MALSSLNLHKFIFNTTTNYNYHLSYYKTKTKNIGSSDRVRVVGGRCCSSAIAINSPSSLTGVSSIRWGSTKLQGAREEMEDDVVIVKSSADHDLDGFSFAAVFDGHAGYSSVKFLRDELYRECVTALQGGILLTGKNFNVIKKALQDAFQTADEKLINWLETSGEETESGSTATALFINNDFLFISHVGDSCAVLSRSGKPEVLTGSHRPYGSNKASLNEIRRIREAGGWIVNGRICGDISVSRAFGDMRFKTKKYEMLEKGVQEGRWSPKFVSRIKFSGDLVTVCPDVFQVDLGVDTEFLLLASDGLWDYINSSEAVTFVRNQLRKHGDVQMACEALGQVALDRRSQDNITIVIADFGRTNWQSVPIQQQNIIFELGQAFATLGIVSFGIWMTSMLG